MTFEKQNVYAEDYIKSNWRPDEGTRFMMCPFDNTSFGINFQLERGNAGYAFDGVDTGSHAVNIEFKASMYKKAGNPILYPDLAIRGGSDDKIGTLVLGNKHIDDKAYPEMWICCDTYWTWSIDDGVKYYNRGVPAGYD